MRPESPWPNAGRRPNGSWPTEVEAKIRREAEERLLAETARLESVAEAAPSRERAAAVNEAGARMRKQLATERRRIREEAKQGEAAAQGAIEAEVGEAVDRVRRDVLG